MQPIDLQPMSNIRLTAPIYRLETSDKWSKIMNRTAFLALFTACMSLGSAEAQPSTSWRYQETKGALTDLPNYSAYTAINDYKVLVVGCTAGMIYVSAKLDYLDMVMGDFRNVAWRVDDGEAVYQQWENRKKGGAILYDGPAMEFAQKIRDANTRIVVRSNDNTEQFGVRGSTRAVGKVLKNCKRQ